MMLHRTRRNCTVRPYLFLGRDVLKDIIPNNSKGQLVKHQLRLTATKPIYNFFITNTHTKNRIGTLYKKVDYEQ